MVAQVMLHESNAFRSLFKTVSYLEGGVDSGFNKVEPGAFSSRLLQIKRVKKNTAIIQVPCRATSLNHGDVFILDTGATIYAWEGADCSPFEKLAADQAAYELASERNGASSISREADEYFWSKLGGEPRQIASKEEAGETLPKPPEGGEAVLFQLSDSSGELTMSEVGRGSLGKGLLHSDDVYVCDAGGEGLLVWVGAGTTQKERAAAMNTATKYLKQYGKKTSTPVTVLKEHGADRNKIFQKVFAY